MRLVNYQSQLSDVIGSANLPSSRARAHLRRLGNRDESPHLGRAVLRILRDLDLPFRAYRISAGMLQLATSHRYLIYIERPTNVLLTRGFRPKTAAANNRGAF